MLRLLFFAMTFLCSSIALADHETKPGYGDGYEEPKPGDDYDKPSDDYEFKCSVIAVIEVDDKYSSRREASERCKFINSIFSEGCSVERVGRRSYKAVFKKSWTFEATSSDYEEARWIVLEEYTDFAYRKAFGPKLPHSLTFSQCGPEDYS